ncbi:olfactory receptor 2T3-like [Marmota marmota marmota]|uniref:olfactory receptor 2T3-like n=1 Tax=Marmota marmota marmota TaxID=9994 RepID=UPI002092B3F7|nr:olfactory receptor 2T3-like [Marmota marmota marmota]
METHRRPQPQRQAGISAVCEQEDGGLTHSAPEADLEAEEEPRAFAPVQTSPPESTLSCSDVSLYKMLLYLCCILMLLVPTLVISSSYTLILLLIRRTSSAKGCRKALATCSSHMTVVLLFFGAAVYTYMLPGSYHTAQQDMMVSAFYTILTPLLNPLIYSLRNKDITLTLRSLVQSRWCCRRVVRGNLRGSAWE